MQKDYNTYYVIATKDGESKTLYYYTGKESFYGGYLLSNILEAKRFKSQKEVIDFLSKDNGFWFLGVNIIGIAGVTFAEIENNEDLFKKYHTLEYAIRL
jgi:hypothetical protein